MGYMRELEHLQGGPLQLTDYETGRLRQILDTHDEGDALIALSRFGSGYVREIAVGALAEHASVESLAALVERLNDWVPQVRQRAITSIRKFLVQEHAGLLLQALASLMALADKGRVDHGATLSEIRAVLKAPQARMAVEATFMGCRGRAARFLFELMLEGATDSAALLEVALTHGEMTVRQIAVDACAVLPAAQALPLLESAMKTPGASVRVKALRGLLTFSADPRAHLRAAMLDASAAMRSLALWPAPQWALDCREVLLKRLAEAAPHSKREWLGLVGLARELEEPQAESMLVLALATTFPGVRLQALEALGERGLAHQINALNDPHDKLFKCAAALLDKRPWQDFDEALEFHLNTLWHELSDHRRNTLLRLKPCWRQLEYLLRRHEQAPADSAYWLERIGRWCAAQYTLVDPQTPKVVRQALLQRLHALESTGELPAGTMSRLN
ncbi:PBS lyase [Pseudomonas sp. Irchel s3h14]|uniref:PBS lyase n=1 Tax=Pseudomonas sp. Irchel s3h14 TaxID=2009179 RepID=UPI000BA39B94|nr:PBS lyase [Pseudomonas sp. Irchel s3h14]